MCAARTLLEKSTMMLLTTSKVDLFCLYLATMINLDINVQAQT